MLQQNSVNRQPPFHYSGNVFQPPGDKGEMDLFRDMIKQLKVELAKSSPVIGSTTVANYDKNFIFSKIITLSASVENSDPQDS